jgi:hypothetical protein
MKIKVTKNRIFAVLAGVVVGAIVLIGVRAALYSPKHTHYHADFALYINGQRDEFKSFTFYEEVQSCDSNETMNPKIRAHMHDNNNHIVHVHDDGVTWEAFFANLGYNLSNTIIQTDTGNYINGADGKKLTFTLNGEQVTSIANKTIGSQDRLLISYGAEDAAALQAQYKTVPSDAHEFNIKNDPSSCSGSHNLTLLNRLKAGLGLSQ